MCLIAEPTALDLALNAGATPSDTPPVANHVRIVGACLRVTDKEDRIIQGLRKLNWEDLVVERKKRRSDEGQAMKYPLRADSWR